MFHFNKASIQDASVPSWVVKAKGQSYYVDHVTSNAPWSTKETPDNEHTKGSIKFKNVDLVIDDENCAEITVKGANAVATDARLYIHQHTNPIQPWYGLWVISFEGKYLHKDGSWGIGCYDQDSHGNYTALWQSDEMFILAP